MPVMLKNVGMARKRLMRGTIAITMSAVAWGSNVPLARAAYQVIPVTDGGTIEGTVTLTGTSPAAASLKITKNQDFCGQSLPNPTYLVGAGGGLANVVVYLSDIGKGKGAPSEPLALVNQHCMFTPRAQGAMVGGQIRTSNDDMVLHNTHPRNAETNSTIYNIALPFKGFAVTKPLPGTPGLIEIKCDAHEWMKAWIVEVENPYYATTDAQGHFAIKDVPPGNYTLVAWHEAAGQKSQKIVVEPGHTASAVMTLAAK
jgi:hypothetical protein